MEPEPHPASEPWAVVLDQLVKSGRRQGLTREDADDRAQDALLRLIKERPRPGAPPVEVRAGRTLRLAITDEARRRSRKGEVPQQRKVALDAYELQDVPADVDLDRRLRFMEAVRGVHELVGHDVVRLLMEGQAGYTEAESDTRRGLDAPSTGSLRKRISRALPEIADRITDLEGDR